MGLTNMERRCFSAVQRTCRGFDDDARKDNCCAGNLQLDISTNQISTIGEDIKLVNTTYHSIGQNDSKV